MNTYRLWLSNAKATIEKECKDLKEAQIWADSNLKGECDLAILSHTTNWSQRWRKSAEKKRNKIVWGNWETFI